MEPVHWTQQPTNLPHPSERESSPTSSRQMYRLIKESGEWRGKTKGRMEETLQKVRDFTLIFPSVLKQGRFVSDSFKGEWEYPHEVAEELNQKKSELRQLREIVTRHIYKKERFTTQRFLAPMNAVINAIGRLFKGLYDDIAVHGVKKKIDEALKTLDSLGETYLYLLSRFNPEQYLNLFHFAMEVDAHPQLLHCADESGNSLLHLAAIHRNPRLLIALLEPKLFMFGDQRQAGRTKPSPEIHAVIALPNKEGDTALHLAAKNGDLQSVQLLCLYGAPAELRNEQGKTPLDLASGADKERISQVLKASIPEVGFS